MQPDTPMQQTGRTRRAPPRNATVCGPLLNGSLVSQRGFIHALLLWLCASLAASCSAERSAMEVPAALTGDFVLHVDTDDPLYADIPSVVRFKPELTRAPMEWRVLDPGLPPGNVFHGSSEWWQDRDGTLLLRWSNGFSGIRVTLVAGISGVWSGTATSFWDHIGPTPPAQYPAHMERSRG